MQRFKSYYRLSFKREDKKDIKKKYWNNPWLVLVYKLRLEKRLKS